MGRKSGCLIALLVFAGTIAAILVALYLLLPGLLRPYDLGSKTSVEAYNSALNKIHLKKDAAPDVGEAADYKIKYGKAKKGNVFLTVDEIASFMNHNRPDYYALKNFQIRINKDNTVETAGTLNTEYVFEKVLANKYNLQDAKKALPMLNLIMGDVNVYCKFKAKIANNSVKSLDLQNVGIMGIPVPNQLIDSNEAESFVMDNISSFLKRTCKETGANYKLMEVKNQKLHIIGDFPSSVKHIEVN